MAATGKSEDDPMMGSVFKEFSESYNQAKENWGEPASGGSNQGCLGCLQRNPLRICF